MDASIEEHIDNSVMWQILWLDKPTFAAEGQNISLFTTLFESRIRA